MDIVNDEWEHAGMADITRIAHHYGIFKDLFENKDFLPVIHMDVDYECGEDLYNPVFYGNELAPSEVSSGFVTTFDVPRWSIELNTFRKESCLRGTATDLYS